MGVVDVQFDSPFVSIIVPVYNVEYYIKQCLKSLQDQTLKNIEIIVVDDGSTDNSGLICDMFAKEDSRFKVIHKQNKGLSISRNTGLDLAQADYIMFVDGDDWVEPDFCEAPFRIAEQTESDLVVFQHVRYGRKGVTQTEYFPEEGFIAKDVFLTRYWQKTSVIAWNKLYRKKLFLNVRYPDGRLSEDTAITHRVIYNADKIYLINRYLYHYREDRYNSISNGIKTRTRFINDYFFFRFRRIDDLKSWGYDCKAEEVNTAWYYFISIGRNAEFSERSEKVLGTVEASLILSSSWKRRLAFWIFRLSPALCDTVSVLTGRRVKC